MPKNADNADGFISVAEGMAAVLLAQSRQVFRNSVGVQAGHLVGKPLNRRLAFETGDRRKRDFGDDYSLLELCSPLPEVISSAPILNR